MKYEEALEYVESISMAGIKPGLSNIIHLCERLGNPQDSLKFVHISGTNGKGSTLAYIYEILQSAGIKVGRYVSPTIFEYRERIQVGKRMITKNALAEGMELVKNACDRMVEEGLGQPTPFEVETALAFWYFQREKCEIVVLETGMGGRLDATNLIKNTLVAVIASVSMDHMQFLGKTLGEIAYQKAGIIKEGCSVVTMEQSETVLEVIRNEAKEKQCQLLLSSAKGLTKVHYGVEKQSFTTKEYGKLEISLAGRFQMENVCLALKAIEVLREKGYKITDQAIKTGLAGTKWPGRFQMLAKKPTFIVDGAHNEDAAQKLAESIEFYFTNKRIIYIMGMLKDKEYEKVVQITHKYADQIITITPPENARALKAYELAQCVAEYHGNVTAADSLEEAVEMARLLADKDDVIIAFGSLSYLGRLIRLLEK